MALTEINAAFDEELAEVDVAKSFSVTINAAWTENEFQVDGYDITAGSYEAAEHGAVEALYQLGYRFWTPYWITRPSSLPAGGVTLAKQQRSLPYCNMFNNYGFLRNQETADFDRFITLNGCNDSRRPLGHAWNVWFNADRSWFDDNPTYWSLSGSRPVFDLATPATFEALAQRAAFYLSTRLNSDQRAAWDAPDGDTLPSDLVFPWAARCVQILRTTYSLTQAQLGVYCYGGHRDFGPVADGGYDLTGVYGQVALGFSSAGYGYPGLVDGWAQLLDVTMLRGYGDIAAQEEYIIPSDSGRLLNRLNEYPQYIASGALGTNMETSSSWLKNVVSHYTAMRVWSQAGDPSDTYDAALEELVDSIFEGDSAVSDLYLLWDAAVYSRNEMVKRSFDIVFTMQADSWWRTAFERYLTIQTALINELGTYGDGPYFTHLEEACRWGEALWQDNGGIHVYVVGRQKLGPGATSTWDRQDVYVDGNPHWVRYPAHPTSQDIADAYELVDLDTGYPSVADVPTDINDWVEVALPTPDPGAIPPNGTDTADRTGDLKVFDSGSAGRYVFVGPGTITLKARSSGDTISETSYGAGLHDVTTAAGYDVIWDTGTLYVVCNPAADREQTNTNLWWAYIPLKLKGWHKIVGGSRLSIYDANGRHDLTTRTPPFDPGYYPPQSLVPGTVCVYHQTRGRITMSGANPAISPTRDKILMPRALAALEGLTPI